jgi:hypothetical protein
MSKKKGFRFYKLFFLNRFWTFIYVHFQKLKKSFKNVHIFLISFYSVKWDKMWWDYFVMCAMNHEQHVRI